MGWILDNLSTIFVVCVLLLVVALAIRSMIKDKKKGGCAGGCAGCSGCASAAQKHHKS